MQWIVVGRAGVCWLMVELGFVLNLSGDLDSSQNPNEIQGLPPLHSSPARSRDDDKFRFFCPRWLLGRDCLFLTVSSDLLMRDNLFEIITSSRTFYIQVSS